MTPPAGATEILGERAKLDFVAEASRTAARLRARPRLGGRRRRSELRKRVASAHDDLLDAWEQIAATTSSEDGAALQYQARGRRRPQRCSTSSWTPSCRRCRRDAQEVPGQPLDARRRAEREPLARDPRRRSRSTAGGARHEARRPGTRPHGQIRQSQVVTTFGPGAMVDLPNHSVIVGGLDTGPRTATADPRAAARREARDAPRAAAAPALRPAAGPRRPDAPRTGITAWQFPEWFITQDVELATSGAARPLAPARPSQHLTKGKFIDDDRKKRTGRARSASSRPARGATSATSTGTASSTSAADACRRAAVDRRARHQRRPRRDLRPLRVRPGRASPDAARHMPRAPLGHCNGARPWLGPRHAAEACDAAEPPAGPLRQQRLLPPDHERDLAARPRRSARAGRRRGLGGLPPVRRVDRRPRARADARPTVTAALEGFTDEEVFAEIQRRKAAGPGAAAQSVKQAEIETLLSPGRRRSATTSPTATSTPAPLDRRVRDQPDGSVERVVLVHRLREVMAQVGFTRFEAVTPDVEGELELERRRAPLARESPGCRRSRTGARASSSRFSRRPIDDWLARARRPGAGRSVCSAGFERWQEGPPRHADASSPACPTSCCTRCRTC